MICMILNLAQARAYLSASMEVIEFWGVRPYSGAWGVTAIYSEDFSAALAASDQFKMDGGISAATKQTFESQSCACCVYRGSEPY